MRCVTPLRLAPRCTKFTRGDWRMVRYRLHASRSAPAGRGFCEARGCPKTTRHTAPRSNFAAKRPDARSDVFAYGALVYEIACGYRAFPGTGAELNQNILTRPTAPLPVRSAIYTALDSVIAGCLEKDPAQRRQRVQNAVIELKLATRAPSHSSCGSRGTRRCSRLPRSQSPRRRLRRGCRAAMQFPASS